MPETAPHRSIHRSRRQCCCMFPQPVFLRYILPSYPRCMSRYHYRCQSRLLSSKPATGPRQPCHRSCRRCYCRFLLSAFLRYTPPSYRCCRSLCRCTCRSCLLQYTFATGPRQSSHRSRRRCCYRFPRLAFLLYSQPRRLLCMSAYQYTYHSCS
ncbi:MAG: hypothetical protein BWX66_00654 [Deltaproteobacteria bacterium ADurb.Bin058]|nr:MAG: hypothetical protein BWX66_00654 [Deltaproteobacteria bacterium ADurb.Bin058]